MILFSLFSFLSLLILGASDNSCVRYQETQIYAKGVLGGRGLVSRTIDLTSKLNYASSSSSIAAVAGVTVEGEHDGTVEISVVGHSDRFNSVAVDVVSTPVTGVSLEVAALNIIEPMNNNEEPDRYGVSYPKFSVNQVFTATGMTAQLVCLARYSDGYYEDVSSLCNYGSLSPHIGITSDELGKLAVLLPGANSFVEYVINATCPLCYTNAHGLGLITVQLVPPVSVMLSLSDPVITLSGDPAEGLPFSLPITSTLSITVKFADNSTRSFTYPSFDNHAVISIVSNSHLVTVTDNVITGKTTMGPGEAGVVTLQVDFPGLYDGLSASISLPVVVFDHAEMSTSLYPGLPTVIATDKMKTIGCSNVYQKLKVHVSGVLSNGFDGDISLYTTLHSSNPSIADFDNDSPLILSGLAFGSVDITGLFGDIVVPSKTVYALNEGAAIRTIAVGTLPGTPATLSSVVGGSYPLDMLIVFQDGSVYYDVISGVVSSWLPISQIATFSSSDPFIVNVTNNGTLIIHENSYKPVTITVTSVCDTTITTSTSFFANLVPAEFDADIGVKFGAPVPAVNIGDFFTVDVSIQGSGATNVVAFEIVVLFDSEYLNVKNDANCIRGSGWPASSSNLWDCTTNDPVNQVLIAGSCAAQPSSKCGTKGLINVGRLTFQALRAGLTEVSGYVVKVQGETQSSSRTYFVAGDVTVNILNAPLSQSAQVAINSTLQATSGLAVDWTTPVNNCLSHGDTNGDCRFDISDVLFSQYYNLGLVSINSVSNSQVVYLDADVNGIVDNKDTAMIMASKMHKTRFFTELSTFTGMNNVISLTVNILDVLLNSGSDVEVYFDVQWTDPVRNSTVVYQGTKAGQNGMNLYLKSVYSGNGKFGVQFYNEDHLPFSIAIVVKTFDSLQISSNFRIFSYYCTGFLASCVSSLGAANAYVPYFSNIVSTRAPTAVPTTAVPSSIPTSIPTTSPTTVADNPLVFSVVLKGMTDGMFAAAEALAFCQAVSASAAGTTNTECDIMRHKTVPLARRLGSEEYEYPEFDDYKENSRYLTDSSNRELAVVITTGVRVTFKLAINWDKLGYNDRDSMKFKVNDQLASSIQTNTFSDYMHTFSNTYGAVGLKTADVVPNSLSGEGFTMPPTSVPTSFPTISHAPTSIPTSNPSGTPTSMPSHPFHYNAAVPWLRYLFGGISVALLLTVVLIRANQYYSDRKEVLTDKFASKYIANIENSNMAAKGVIAEEDMMKQEPMESELETIPEEEEYEEDMDYGELPTVVVQQNTNVSQMKMSMYRQ